MLGFGYLLLHWSLNIFNFGAIFPLSLGPSPTRGEGSKAPSPLEGEGGAGVSRRMRLACGTTSRCNDWRVLQGPRERGPRWLRPTSRPLGRSDSAGVRHAAGHDSRPASSTPSSERYGTGIAAQVVHHTRTIATPPGEEAIEATCDAGWRAVWCTGDIECCRPWNARDIWATRIR